VALPLSERGLKIAWAGQYEPRPKVPARAGAVERVLASPPAEGTGDLARVSSNGCFLVHRRPGAQWIAAEDGDCGQVKIELVKGLAEIRCPPEVQRDLRSPIAAHHNEWDATSIQQLGDRLRRLVAQSNVEDGAVQLLAGSQLRCLFEISRSAGTRFSFLAWSMDGGRDLFRFDRVSRRRARGPAPQPPSGLSAWRGRRRAPARAGGCPVHRR